MSRAWRKADFDFEARIALGAVASGIGDVGLVLAILDRVTDGDSQSWFDAWTGMAAELVARGDQALGRGHRQTASWAFLAAAEYYAKAQVFVDVAARITTPLLILDPDNEQFFPGQPRQLYDLLPGEKQMLDWLADHLPARQAADVSPGQTTLGGSLA